MVYVDSYFGVLGSTSSTRKVLATVSVRCPSTPSAHNNFPYGGEKEGCLRSSRSEFEVRKVHSIRNEIVFPSYNTSRRPASRGCVGDVLFHSGSHLCHE